MTPTVHVLFEGRALCGNVFGGPSSWGPAMRWVGFLDPAWREHATCATCREQNEKMCEKLGVYPP